MQVDKALHLYQADFPSPLHHINDPFKSTTIRSTSPKMSHHQLPNHLPPPRRSLHQLNQAVVYHPDRRYRQTIVVRAPLGVPVLVRWEVGMIRSRGKSRRRDSWDSDELRNQTERFVYQIFNGSVSYTTFKIVGHSADNTRTIQSSPFLSYGDTRLWSLVELHRYYKPKNWVLVSSRVVSRYIFPYSQSAHKNKSP